MNKLAVVLFFTLSITNAQIQDDKKLHFAAGAIASTVEDVAATILGGVTVSFTIKLNLLNFGSELKNKRKKKKNKKLKNEKNINITLLNN